MRRRLASVVLAIAMLGAIAFVAPSGGATTGETCTHVGGVALFVPPLPKVPSHATVPFVIQTKGMKVYTCTGTGGAAGNVAFTVRAHAKTNCQLLAHAAATTLVGAGTIKWTKGKQSTFLVTLKLPRQSPLDAQLTGSVTAGQFKGLPLSAALALQVDVRMCAAQPLSRATLRFANGTAFVVGKTPPTTTTTTYTLPPTTTMMTTTTTTTMPDTTSTTDTTSTPTRQRPGPDRAPPRWATGVPLGAGRELSRCGRDTRTRLALTSNGFRAGLARGGVSRGVDPWRPGGVACTRRHRRRVRARRGRVRRRRRARGSSRPAARRGGSDAFGGVVHLARVVRGGGLRER